MAKKRKRNQKQQAIPISFHKNQNKSVKHQIQLKVANLDVISSTKLKSVEKKIGRKRLRRRGKGKQLEVELELEEREEIEIHDDCLFDVFSFLMSSDLCQVMRVCKRWYNLSSQKSLVSFSSFFY